MARSRSRRPFVVPLPDAQSGLRHVLLRTIPGRLIVGGGAVRLLLVVFAAAAGPLPPAFTAIDTMAGIAIAVGAAYFVVRLFIATKRRLLWRVRRKLILSYIFVGFIPAILIVAFFLLVGFLLFNNLSSYLVQTRLRALGDEARFLAQSTALEGRTPDSRAPNPEPLFISQRHHRIDPRRPPRGHEARQHRRAEQHHRHEPEDERIVGRLLEQERPEPLASGERHHHADHDSDHADPQAFGDDEFDEVPLLCPEGGADAHLLRPLRDGVCHHAV